MRQLKIANKTAVIYIAGLGDNNPKSQMLAVKLWKIHRIKPVFFRVGWEDSTPFNEKLDRLNKLIDELYIQHGRVGVIASSAGVSMALHAYSMKHDKISAVVSICGKIGRPNYVLDVVKAKNPSFAESMSLLPQALNNIDASLRKRVFCVVPYVDKIVDTQDQVLDGANVKKVFSFGHIATIALQISVFSKKNIGYIKRIEQLNT